MDRFTKGRKALVGLACAISFGGGSLVAMNIQSAGSTPVTYKVVSKVVMVPRFQIERIDVRCPAGLRPTGGGGHVGVGTWPRASTAGAYVSESSINLAGNGWETTVVVENGKGPIAFTVSAVCANI